MTAVEGGTRTIPRNASAIITQAEVTSLLAEDRGPCISVYMPFRPGEEPGQSAIRRKDARHLLTERLREWGLSPIEIKHLLKPLRALSRVPDITQHGTTQVFFRSPTLTSVFVLPCVCRPYTMVMDHFFVLPLLPLLADDRVAILILSLTHVRLLVGSRTGLTEIALPDPTPTALYPPLNHEKLLKTQTQEPAIAHEQPVPAFTAPVDLIPVLEKRDIFHFFQRLDSGVQATLRADALPLVLAGPASLFPIYHRANTYPHLMEEGIAGNADRLSAPTLLQRASTIVKPLRDSVWQQEIARYKDLRGTGRTSDTLTEIVTAAADGKVDVLFVTEAQFGWGKWNATRRSIELHEIPQSDDEDCVNLAAILALRAGATVYVVPPECMPDPSPAAAMLRY